MYDIISIGSSVIDSFIMSKSFQVQKTDQGVLLCQTYGEKIDVDEYIIRSGGGGSNTAVGFSRMGFRVGIVTELGTDVWSEFILNELRKEKVAANMVVTEKNEKTGGSIILLGEDGGRTIMVHRGAAAQLDPTDIPVERVSRAKWVHLSSISGQEKTVKFIFDVIKDSDVKLSWNPGAGELELLNKDKIKLHHLPVDIMFVNKHEWDLLEEKKSEILQAVRHIVVTNGKHGGDVYIEGKINTKFVANEVPFVDETGAGDAFIVGYLSAQMKGKSIGESCAWGKSNAESVVAKIGAKPGLLTIKQMESHNKNYE